MRLKAIFLKVFFLLKYLEWFSKIILFNFTFPSTKGSKNLLKTNKTNSRPLFPNPCNTVLHSFALKYICNQVKCYLRRFLNNSYVKS